MYAFVLNTPNSELTAPNLFGEEMVPFLDLTRQYKRIKAKSSQRPEGSMKRVTSFWERKFRLLRGSSRIIVGFDTGSEWALGRMPFV